MGSFGHLKLKGVSVSSLQHPSDIASVLEVLISSPDINLNSSSSLKSCSLLHGLFFPYKHDGVIGILRDFYFLCFNINSFN